MNTRTIAASIAATAAIAASLTTLAPVLARRPQTTGIVRDPDGRARAGLFVSATPSDGRLTHSVLTDANGRYDLAGIPPATYTLAAEGPGFRTIQPVRFTWDPTTAPPDLSVAGRLMTLADLPSSAFLRALPDGDEKRRFILDCTGCHILDRTIATPGDTQRTADSWAEATGRMLGFAGPQSSFPVISPGRDPAATAAFLAPAFAPGRVVQPAMPAEIGSTALITEYPIPQPQDLPHDVAIAADGKVLITGMFTHRLYVLDPATGVMDLVPIPVTNANPRAVEVDGEGGWWVLLGGPQRIARYQPATQEWTSWPIGLYPHSIGLGADGRVWFNGHFTRAPELIGYLEPATGSVVRDTAPAHPAAASGFGPIPYELRMGPDGRVWVSELAGNRVLAYDPVADAYRVFEMLAPHSGPRRLDVGPDGIVWIPEYAGNRLVRLDPATGRMDAFAMPVADALPYVVRVDARTGHVWVGTAAADALIRFDPTARRFTTYPLPTRGALIRHLAIDPRTGDVWAAYGASPGVPSKVARIHVR